MKDKKINLSKNLIYLRRKKRLSIEQVAGEIGVSRQAVSKWETGETLRTITGVTRRFYPNWDQSAYQRYLSVFDLDEQKQVRQLSEGMKVKYRIALALSHGARLFLFDEPTSGLDPVAREELLELFFTCQFAREMVSVGGAGGQGVHCSHRPGASADRPDGGGGTPALMEAAVHLPALAWLDSLAPAELIRQLPILCGGAVVYAAGSLLAYRTAAARFERVDL